MAASWSLLIRWVQKLGGIPYAGLGVCKSALTPVHRVAINLLTLVFNIHSRTIISHFNIK